MTSLAWAEAAARQFEPGKPKHATPGELAQRIDPRIVQTPALDLMDAELVRAFNTPDGRLIWLMPPQEGKSDRTMKFIIWALTQNPDLRIINASYAQGLANRNGRSIRNAILTHPELGIDIAPDNGAAHEWQIAGHDGGVLAVGRGAGATGRACDLLVIVDPIKDRKEADSEIIRQTCIDWWTDVLSTRLAPGASVVLIETRWHENDLAGYLQSAPDGHVWRTVNVPALADHNPAKGETDPLGREPGEFMQSARKRTARQWESIRVRVGPRTWNALYQGRPAPAEGGIFKRDNWVYYQTPMWIDRPDGSKLTTGFDLVLASWDMTFKDTSQSDYVVGQVWGFKGADSYLLDQVRGRWDFPETLRQVAALAAKWPDALLKIVEDKANGTAVLASLRRTIPGLVPETPTESKTARAAAVSPLQESKNVHLPDPALAPWVGDFVEECAGFPNAAHDDQVDTMSQALKRGILIPLMEQQDDQDPDDYDDFDDMSLTPL
jgi:predicted phage terminase large subunit-like protein